MNEIYYKIYLTVDNKVSILCLQDFDEDDYNQFRFLTDIRFSSEQQAKDYLNNNSTLQKILSLSDDIITTTQSKINKLLKDTEERVWREAMVLSKNPIDYDDYIVAGRQKGYLK